MVLQAKEEIQKHDSMSMILEVGYTGDQPKPHSKNTASKKKIICNTFLMRNQMETSHPRKWGRWEADTRLVVQLYSRLLHTGFCCYFPGIHTYPEWNNHFTPFSWRHKIHTMPKNQQHLRHAVLFGMIIGSWEPVTRIFLPHPPPTTTTKSSRQFDCSGIKGPGSLINKPLFFFFAILILRQGLTV